MEAEHRFSITCSASHFPSHMLVPMVNELSRIVTSMCLKGSVSRAVEEDEHETSDVLLRKREKDTDNTSTLWNTGMRFQTVFQVKGS